jgi:uncharacterized membrane protein (UPF0127 family)
MMRAAGVVLAVMLGLAGCQKDTTGPEPMPRVVVDLATPAGQHVIINAEVANNPTTRAEGLMFREHMEDDAGMLFVWPQPQPQSFWMKNTKIPLDMLFIRNHKVVAVVANAKPMDETPLSPTEMADAVLEVNGSWAERHNIGLGATVTWKPAE